MMSLQEDMESLLLKKPGKLEDAHMVKFCELFERNTGMTMQDPILYQTPSYIHPIEKENTHIQIIFGSDDQFINQGNIANGHWICTYYKNGVIYVYDSMNTKDLHINSSNYLAALYPFITKIEYKKVQQQENGIDCGVFAIAFAVSLSLNKDPLNIRYDKNQMREHLYNMLINNIYEEFPYDEASNFNDKIAEEKNTQLLMHNNSDGRIEKPRKRRKYEKINWKLVMKTTRSTVKNQEEKKEEMTIFHIEKFIEVFHEKSGIEMRSVHNRGDISPITSGNLHIQIMSADPRIEEIEKNHWICLHYTRNMINIYDSQNELKLNSHLSTYIGKLFSNHPMIVYNIVQKAEDECNRILFAIAFAISLTFGKDPSKFLYNEMKMREHFFGLLRNNSFEGFPYIKDDVNRSSVEEDAHQRRIRLKNLSQIKMKSKMTIEQKMESKKKNAVYRSQLRMKKLKKNIGGNYISGTNLKQKAMKDLTKRKSLRIISDIRVDIPLKIVGGIEPRMIRNLESRIPNNKDNQDNENNNRNNNGEVRNQRMQRKKKIIALSKIKEIINQQTDNINFIDIQGGAKSSRVNCSTENIPDEEMTKIEKKYRAEGKFLIGINPRKCDERHIIPHYAGEMNIKCKLCKALHFQEERPVDGLFTHCCHKGKVKLENLGSYPKFLKELLSKKSQYSADFLKNIRSYNSALAFASMGAKLVTPPGTGPFVYKIHGQIYHNTYSLHPNEEIERKYGQLYVIDTKQATEERLKNKYNSECNFELLELLDKLMREVNPYAGAYRMMYNVEKEEEEKAKTENRPMKTVLMWIKRDGKLDKNIYNPPTCNEVAVVFTSEDGEPPIYRDICIHPKSSRSIPVCTLSPNVDPMTYPILFPRGERGWTINIGHQYGTKNITPLQFYSYRLSVRNTFNPCLSAGMLTQQYIVDVWTKIEGERLKYIKEGQHKLRAELYSGLMDYVKNKAADNNCIPPGRIIILPSSFQSGPRAYQQLYMDALSLTQRLGKPQLFITMTCNPNWPEIQENLREGETPSDRPDLVSRVFKMKVDVLKDLLLKQKVFGTPTGYLYVTEFQKRGLPHIHLLLFFEKEYMIRDADTVDKIVCAEIPDNDENPILYELVKKFMIHGPCGKQNSTAPCMDQKTKKCVKKFPKEFSQETIMGDNSYPIYRRRNNGRTITFRNRIADNRFVVPYNIYLLLVLVCHINVEVCSPIMFIKYLFKYCYKGHAAALLEFCNERNENSYKYDEIQQYLSTRYVCPQEAMHRINEFKMHEQSHAVVRLAVHLENQQTIYFKKGCEENAIESLKNTTLMAWFELNRNDEDARQYLYTEIPNYYVFDEKTKKWIKRMRFVKPVISRLYFVSPRERERYSLRLLLLHVKGARDFAELRTYENVTYETFIQAARMRDLIETNDEIEKCLEEAVQFEFPKQLCKLFAYICVFSSPDNALGLWEKYKEKFMDPQKLPEVAEQLALKTIKLILAEHGFYLNDFSLPEVNESIIDAQLNDSDEYGDQFDINAYKKEILIIESNFCDEQKLVYSKIISAVENEAVVERYFFLDGPGGTGKSYLLNAIIMKMLIEKKSVIPVAWTGIAANLLIGGKTVHSVFKLPLSLNESSVCNVTSRSKAGNLLRISKLIIWDEVTMAPKYALQAIDLLLKDLMENDKPFGGKVILLSGDFRQILPIVRYSNRTAIVENCVKNSHLWKFFRQISLVKNFRIQGEQKNFQNWLLNIGEGKFKDEYEEENSVVEIPPQIICKKNLIHEIYGDSMDEHDSNYWNSAILTPLNIDVLRMNNEVIKILKGEEKIYYSIDQNMTEEDLDKNYIPIEYMNSITPNGFPPHKLILKKGAIVMLLRNLHVNGGLCNGTKLLVLELQPHLLITEVITGKAKGEFLLLPRIKLITAEHELPFTMSRKQFPIRLAYVMTINKAQGQTLDKVGIYLESPVFAHGQFYVGISRVRKQEDLKILLLEKGSIKNSENGITYTKNVVYREIL